MTERQCDAEPDPPREWWRLPHDNCDCAVAPADPRPPIDWRVPLRPVRWHTMEAAKWNPQDKT